MPRGDRLHQPYMQVNEPPRRAAHDGNWRKIAITLKPPANGRTDGANLRYRLVTTSMGMACYNIYLDCAPP